MGRVGLLAVLVLVLAASVSGEEFTAETLDAVVKVRAEIPADARTAGSLGPLREGSGVVIDSRGLILTIGYLILEASRVRVTDARAGWRRPGWWPTTMPRVSACSARSRPWVPAPCPWECPRASNAGRRC